VELAGQPITGQSVGSADLGVDQVLSTGQGKAEILLTPGVFLRLDNDSALRMESPDLTHTAVDLERGRAMVEVDQIYPQNNIQIVEQGGATQLLKRGLYEFNADKQLVMVFDGEAAVRNGAGNWQPIKSHHQLLLVSGDPAKARKFDVSANKGDLYNWSSLRSQYLSEANYQIAGQYAGAPGFVPGWYWDPYLWNYTFIGAGPFWSPFGWGFYPPWYFGYAGYYRGYRGGYPGRGYVGGYGMHAFAGGGFHGGGGGGHR
jgi:hypothetical protein